MLLKAGGSMQKCENFLCIYQNNGRCALENVSLDEGGRCTECVLTNFEKEVLERAKKEMFIKINI